MLWVSQPKLSCHALGIADCSSHTLTLRRVLWDLQRCKCSMSMGGHQDSVSFFVAQTPFALHPGQLYPSSACNVSVAVYSSRTSCEHKDRAQHVLSSWQLESTSDHEYKLKSACRMCATCMKRQTPAGQHSADVARDTSDEGADW